MPWLLLHRLPGHIQISGKKKILQKMTRIMDICTVLYKLWSRLPGPTMGKFEFLVLANGDTRGGTKAGTFSTSIAAPFFWGVKTCKNPLPTRQRTRGESIRRVPELPCGTKGCKTDILPHSTYHRTILGLKCQHPPSPRHPLNSHFVRRVKLRLAYRPAFATCHFNGIMFNSSQIMFQKNQKTQDRGIWFSMFKSCKEV